MKKVYIVIAAFNEEERIEKVIKDLKSTNYNNIIVVDDGSEDNTYQRAFKPGVHVLKHLVNRGQGASLKTGIDFALQKKADIIITFDADGQFLVKEIKKLIEPIENKEADVVLGSRFLGKAVNIPKLKRLVLKLGVIVVFVLYRIKITDSQCGFRAISKHAAQKINIMSDRMEHAGEIFYEIMKHKLKYKEVPVTVIYDKYSLKKGQDWVKSVGLGIKMFFNRFMR